MPFKSVQLISKPVKIELFLNSRGASALTADIIAKLGVLRKGLNMNDIKDMQPDGLEELQLNDDDLDREENKQLFKSRQGRVTNRRKRATTG